MDLAPTPAAPDRLDAIETLLADLMPAVAVAPATRGRPQVVPSALLWGAMLVCILHGAPRQRAVWRLVSGAGLGPYPAVPISAEAVRKRLVTAGSDPMATRFTQITDALVERTDGDLTLAPFAPGGVYALDATTLDKVAHTRPTDDGPARPLAGTLHSVYDVRRQLFRTIMPTDLPHQNERAAAPDLAASLPPQSLLLMDRGCLSFAWFDPLTATGHGFISRLREHTTVVPEHTLTSTARIQDDLVWLGKHRSDKARHLARVVTVTIGPGVRRYVTNVLDPQVLPVAEIGRLSARRWDIELAFKTVTRELGLHLIWSTSWDMILTQVWGTLLIAQIVSAVRQELAIRAQVDLFDVSVSLLLADLPAYVQRGAPDVLGTIAARGTYGGIIRPSRRKQVHLPRDVPVTPPPPDLPLVRAHRYAGKA